MDISIVQQSSVWTDLKYLRTLIPAHWAWSRTFEFNHFCNHEMRSIQSDIQRIWNLVTSLQPISIIGRDFEKFRMVAVHQSRARFLCLPHETRCFEWPHRTIDYPYNWSRQRRTKNMVERFFESCTCVACNYVLKHRNQSGERFNAITDQHRNLTHHWS
jgi:hypothetical protein